MQPQKRKGGGKLEPFINFSPTGQISPASKSKQFRQPVPSLGDRPCQNFPIFKQTPNAIERHLTPDPEPCSVTGGSAGSSQQTQIDFVFCPPSQLQKALYAAVQYLMTLKESDQKKLLALLCNHPVLLYQKVMELSSGLQHQGTKKSKKEFVNFSGVTCCFPTRFELSQCQVSDSGKLLKLFEMATDEKKSMPKLIILSSYSKTLDLLENLFSRIESKFAIFRINANTPVTVLPQIVRQILDDSNGRHKIILLNAKTERLGPDLFSSSRLVYYDFDSMNDCKALNKWGAESVVESIHVLVTLDTFEVDECSSNSQSQSTESQK